MFNRYYFYLDRKYNGVDTDWIDLKSNNYFSNEENYHFFIEKS